MGWGAFEEDGDSVRRIGWIDGRILLVLSTSCEAVRPI